MSEKITPQPEQTTESKKLNLDEIPELGKNTAGIYYLKIPKKHKKEEYRQKYDAKMNTEYIIKKKGGNKPLRAKLKRINNEIDQIKNRRYRIFSRKLRNNIKKCFKWRIRKRYTLYFFQAI